MAPFVIQVFFFTKQSHEKGYVNLMDPVYHLIDKGLSYVIDTSAQESEINSVASPSVRAF